MLVKFFEKKKYAEAFVKGELYLNSVSYFREHNDLVRGDAYEGRPTLPPFEKIEINGNESPVDNNAPLTNFTFKGIESVNLLCFSNLKLENKILQMDNKYFEFFGKYFVIIRNPDPFQYNLFKTCMKHDYYCINDSVEYYDSSKGEDHMWMATKEQYEPLRILMVKDIKYEWQREYRFVINREIDTISPMVLDIGNIQDYVYYGNIDEILARNK